MALTLEYAANKNGKNVTEQHKEIDNVAYRACGR